ncbi:MAG: oligosaccharide flippase family protein [Acidobacteria bacterium]|nr:oligosaccharide flippase family protein [Acidobacteriota bacterium]
MMPFAEIPLREPVPALRRAIAHPVARNAMGLYAVQFGGYVIPLAVVPYLARVLRPDGFGLLVFAQSFAVAASLTIEYGFGLSATREMARAREHAATMAELISGVQGAKAVLSIGLLLVAALAALAIPNFRHHGEYLAWALLSAVAMGFSPFWYYQGRERMTGAAVTDLVCRALGALLVLAVVRAENDGWKALMAQAIAGCGCTLLLSARMYRETPFRRLEWRHTLRALRTGRDMFLFRGAYNFYSSANAFILGMFAAPLQVGYFGGAERIARAVQSLTQPVSQAVYPRVSHLAVRSAARAAWVVRLTIAAATAAGFGLGVGLALAAPWLTAKFLGPAYAASVSVLAIFAMVIPVNAANTALIMHWALPSGRDRSVTAITMGAIAINLAGAAALAPRFAHIGMAWAILMAEGCKLLALSAILIRHGLFAVEVKRSFAAGELQSPGAGV